MFEIIRDNKVTTSIKDIRARRQEPTLEGGIFVRCSLLEEA